MKVLEGKDKTWLKGYLAGMKRMYHATNWRDVEEWFGEDPHATFLTLTALVIEELTE